MVSPATPWRSITAGLLGLIATGGAVGAVPGPVTAAEGPAPPPARRLIVDLAGQDIAVEPDGDLRIVLRLSGDLTDLLPPAITDPEAPGPEASGPVPAPPSTTAPDAPAAGADLPSVDELNLVVVNYEPLSAVDDPATYIGSGVRTDALSEAIDGVAVPDVRNLVTVADDGTVALDLTIGTDSGESGPERIQFDDPGVYPVVVSLIRGSIVDGEVIARYGTIVERLPGAGEARASQPPIDLALVTRVGEVGPEPTDAELAAARRELDDIVAFATAIESPVTHAIPPFVLASAAGEAGVEQALAGDGLVSLPATPMDVSSAAEAGRSDLFARDLVAGEDLLAAAIPTNLARRDVWIATEPLSAPGAQVVRDLGYRYVVMTPALYAETIDGPPPETDRFVEIALPDGGTLPLIVVDPLGAALTTAATERTLDRVTAVEWAVATIGELLLDHQRDDDPANRSRILATPDLSAPDPRLVAALETLAPTTPSLRFSAAGTLTGVTDVQQVDGEDAVALLPDRAGPDLSGRLADLEAATLAMLSAGSMLPDDDPRVREWTDRLSALVSTGYTDAEVASEVDRLLAEADRLKAGVVPPEPFTFTLTGRSGDIEIRLANTADEPLTVRLRLSSPKLSFPDSEQLIELRPRDQTTVNVPVRAQTNGTSSVSIEVLTPAGEQLHDPIVLTSHVTALTGLGQVLTGGLILVLLTWWFGHWRARRRETAAANAGEVMTRHPSNAK